MRVSATKQHGQGGCRQMACRHSQSLFHFSRIPSAALENFTQKQHSSTTIQAKTIPSQELQVASKDNVCMLYVYVYVRMCYWLRRGWIVLHKKKDKLCKRCCLTLVPFLEASRLTVNVIMYVCMLSGSRQTNRLDQRIRYTYTFIRINRVVN